jgi:pyrroline-5-carboxylate reductase
MRTIEQKAELEEILEVLGENLSITETQHDAAVILLKLRTISGCGR